MENTELTEIHFIAQMINQRNSIEQGYTMPTRWITLREDLKEQYLKEAQEMFNQWRDEEIDAKKRRQEYLNSR